MRSHLRRTIAVIAGFCTAAALLAVAPTAATAADNADSGTTDDILWSSSAPMYVGGYDEDVARKNGFEIQIVDGIITSVPVTEKAKQMQARWERESAGEITPFNTVTGDCGSSTVTAARTGTGGKQVQIATSYYLSGGRTSYWHEWNVTITTNQGLIRTEPFSGGNNWDSSWVASATTPAYLSVAYGGIAAVRSGSYALLSNGLACYSGGPTDAF